MPESAPTKILIDETAEGMLAHGTAVSLDGRAVLIFGPSGSGKSELALRLIAYGCTLVGDDRVLVHTHDNPITVAAPPRCAGKIEARGIGILDAKIATDPAVLQFAIDMGRVATKRLPDPKSATVCGQVLPCIHKVESDHFPAAVLQYLKGAG